LMQISERTFWTIYPEFLTDWLQYHCLHIAKVWRKMVNGLLSNNGMKVVATKTPKLLMPKYWL
jgi:hypothetical protein